MELTGGAEYIGFDGHRCDAVMQRMLDGQTLNLGFFPLMGIVAYRFGTSLHYNELISMQSAGVCTL